MSSRVVEFQLTTDAFLVGFGNRIRMIDTCFTGSFGLPDSPCSGETMLDHVAFGDATLLPSDTPGVVRLELPATLVIVQTADLPAHGAAAAPPCQTVEATLRFDVFMDVSGGAPSLRSVFAGVDAPDLTAQAATALAFVATGLLPAQSQPFNLAPLAAALGEAPTAAQARIAVTPDGQRLAIRFLIDGGTSVQDEDWTAFDGGAFTLPATTQWSIFISADLIEDAVDSRLSEGLEDSESKGKIDVEAWPNPSLLPWLGEPAVVASFDVEAIDACVCLWGEIDVDVEVSAVVTITVPEPNVLQTDLHLDWDLDDAEVICCAFTAAMLWPFIGTEMLQEGKLGWGEFVAGIFVLPATFLVFLTVAHSTAEEPIASGIPDEWDEISEGTHYRMRTDLDLGPFGIDYTLEGISVQAGGLALVGSLTPPLKRVRPSLATTIFTFSHLAWAVENPCDTQEQWSPRMRWSRRRAYLQILP